MQIIPLNLSATYRNLNGHSPPGPQCDLAGYRAGRGFESQASSPGIFSPLDYNTMMTLLYIKQKPVVHQRFALY